MKIDYKDIKTIDDLAQYLDLDLNKLQSISFWLVDFLMTDIPEIALDNGSYYMPAYVGDKSIEESYKSVLWAVYEEKIEKKQAEPEGPWVAIDPVNGITIHKDKPIYVWDKNEN